MKKEQSRKLLAIIIIAAAALAIIIVLALVLDKTASDPAPSPSHGTTVEDIIGPGEEETPVSFGGKWYLKKPNLETLLFMGVDRSGEAVSTGNYVGSGQADSLMLMLIDHDNQQFTILQINRDTMTEVEHLGVLGEIVGSAVEQIALAHAYGEGLEDSCENTVRAVSNLLYGVDIDSYAAVNMEAMAILNDMVGGVTVTIEDDFSEIDPSLVQGESITLTGEQAAHFLRARTGVGDGSNLSRMRRQSAYMSAFSAQFKAKSGETPALALEIYSAVLPYMVTDLSGQTMSQLVNRCRNYQNAGIVSISGEARQGEEFMEFYPDEEKLIETVLSLFYVETEDRN